ncbi:MAG: glycoside hydrolase family 78 protein [Tannerella sp.]|jgi:alpha-L-rhamnosidase|nr:glycoside hydrolase family 78 protein [Tannerella sp.]
MNKQKILLTLVCAFFVGIAAQAQIIPAGLRCEHLSNPLGIDTPRPRFTWQLKDDRHGAVQQAYRIIVGTDSLSVCNGTGGMWDTERMASDDMSAVYAGKAIEPFTKYFWRVEIWDKDNRPCLSEVASFESGVMELKNWKGDWISDGHELQGRSIHDKSAPYFRKEFAARKKIRSARAYIAVAGLYELYVNGEKIGNHRLDPMYTRFDRRNLYVAYDVTNVLRNGTNAVGVLLGNGWYNHQSTAVWYFDRAPWRNRPAFCMDLHLTYEDGTMATVTTDRSWKTSPAPLIFNSIYTAEHYDARLEQPGWNKAGFDDSKWERVTLRTAPSQNIVSQQLHPIRNVEKVPAKSVKKIDDYTWFYDLGRNISGVSEFRIKGEAGTVITLEHAELLKEDGRINMSNINPHYRPADDSDPFQKDIFILSGNGEEEVFMPKFNYKGFQYVEVKSSKPVELAKENLTGWFMHSDVPPIGSFETSDPLINKIWQATNNAYLSNLFGYPTDCPHREKNGWTGDGHIAIETGLYNFDGITVYEKWLADHRDEQQPNGVLPGIIPTSGWGYHWANGLDWTSTIAIIPWEIYRFYGDSRLLAECYENIKRYVDHVTYLYPDGLTDWGLGDWVPVKSKTPVEFTSSIYYFVDATILANAAGMFDKPDDYRKYTALAEKIKKAVNDKYLNTETCIYGDGVQTELSFPLQWGIVPEEYRRKVADNLAKRVLADDKHIDVGLLGSKSVLNALSENGYADLAFTLASQQTYPSWGYWISKGATTLYENWKTGGGQDASLNHIMFGEIGAWFYKALGGIMIDGQSPGFKNILLKPQFVKDLNRANVSHESPYGKIVSKWERKKGRVYYEAVVPANSTATFFIPAGYKIRKAQLSSGETLDMKKIPDHGTPLAAGRYRFEFQVEK